jgi:hypothetical protein
MTDYRWALLRGSEDGNPLKFISDAELASVLANPAEWGVAEFINAHDMAQLGTDPNYWPDRVAVLLRLEVIVPERARGYSLPAADPDSGHWRPARADGSAVKMGDVR